MILPDVAGKGESIVEVEVFAPGLIVDPDADRPDAATRINQLIAISAGVLGGLSSLAALVVVVVLYRGLGRGADGGALLAQVNPLFMVSIGTFLAAFLLLVAWGIMRLRRPADETSSGAVPAAVGAAFASLAWAFYLYGKLD